MISSLSLNKKLILFLAIIACVGCRNSNKQSVNNPTDSVSIHKLWKFDRIDTIHPLPKNTGAAWIGKNLLDLSHKDTLRLKYQSVKNKPTFYPYNISHDTIFINNRPTYKILKLTFDELHLGLIITTGRDSKPSFSDSMVMIYNAKRSSKINKETNSTVETQNIASLQ